MKKEQINPARTTKSPQLSYDKHANHRIAVQIAEPLPPSPGEHTFKKHYPATSARRLSGRPPLATTTSSRNSLISQTSMEGLSSLAQTMSPPSGSEEAPQPHRHRINRASEKLVSQIAEWLQREKAKKDRKKSPRVPRKKTPPPTPPTPDSTAPEAPPTGRDRAASLESDSSEVSLDRLQRILDDSMAALGLNAHQPPHASPRLGRRHSKRSLSHRSLSQLAKGVSSDTEYHDGDVLVPSCDGFLDNSKSLSYTGGKPGAPDDNAPVPSRAQEKERQAWLAFKNEIIRLAHTLRLKGWRRVPLDHGDLISVERLSGALTNAVYVVSPPADLQQLQPPSSSEDGATKKPPPPPKKVLLRIYGPQVDIDRDNELSVLRRLARKKIGPRLLGTFLNGRFEQFFNATTLTPASLREPETSKQIAKRMRELHDGVELTEEEEAEGPSVWKNWGRWLEQAERTVTALDRYILDSDEAEARRGGGGGDAWKSRGLVCGAEWAVFKGAVDKYRRFLEEYYGGQQKIREKLVFAHNDTQYGNILRIRPDDEKSPLLQPANEHKQLIVIDFEYAGANVRGLEFANHFTEWTYNYHDPAAGFACNTAVYPTPEQQRRFIRAYVEHRPKIARPGGEATGTGTPGLGGATTPSSSSIVDFMLDARVPAGGWKEEEVRREEEVERAVEELMGETRLWRVANSAQWVVWGVVQANIPGLVPDEGQDEEGEGGDKEEREEKAEAEADGFDYLGYAQERALFFWGDCVLLGIVKLEELPESLRGRLKFVKY
ncbi:kinase-like protein [Coniochaeta ligniaria NRRL 30616]|uniref:Kinase-like protein n=1 Tax=Coniochaeta ligniaria NRRL 30616 TaxID=1408157 RepID=A0A1J7JNN3_9PEZI|nr:kinase-like protein [Coniochaeta ligniaria NRRL 30616]